MKVKINGEQQNLPAEITVRGLLEQLDLANGPVAVEINAQLVPRARHDTHNIEPDDEIEIVTVKGGG